MVDVLAAVVVQAASEPQQAYLSLLVHQLPSQLVLEARLHSHLVTAPTQCLAPSHPQAEALVVLLGLLQEHPDKTVVQVAVQTMTKHRHSELGLLGRAAMAVLLVAGRQTIPVVVVVAQRVLEATAQETTLLATAAQEQPPLLLAPLSLMQAAVVAVHTMAAVLLALVALAEAVKVLETERAQAAHRTLAAVVVVAVETQTITAVTAAQALL